MIRFQVDVVWSPPSYRHGLEDVSESFEMEAASAGVARQALAELLRREERRDWTVAWTMRPLLSVATPVAGNVRWNR